METEVEVSFNEYLNTSVSQDSVEVRNEEHQLKINKGSEPFFQGLIKKSVRDFSRSSQHLPNEEHDVLINGKPIPDYMVKRAEKLAGPIQPGDYWYDVRAGFWGKTGEPCLGIIPPFIEEFNYPMPANCSAGNTSVFINGRELHQRDLDLLSSRGLPTKTEKSYILEISGRVFEVDTGKELDSLGRLAPTVEKAKRGFGMKIPRNLSQLRFLIS
ncbi:EXTRA-LARGE G-PROTEIN-LIKE [Salix viminalis]|uniref:EXTRA-LARGE G-PROTEIN-LIKE n=1 Tax=Salix viminalis TaxID=40686 RepID=A0A9Q0QBD4_SALVM|nr:EXTRA-LARGE G-PROTEIN-LIKE [Salix viminalis]